jgi:hypothetical protein
VLAGRCAPLPPHGVVHTPSRAGATGRGQGTPGVAVRTVPREPDPPLHAGGAGSRARSSPGGDRLDRAAGRLGIRGARRQRSVVRPDASGGCVRLAGRRGHGGTLVRADAAARAPERGTRRGEHRLGGALAGDPRGHAARPRWRMPAPGSGHRDEHQARRAAVDGARAIRSRPRPPPTRERPRPRSSGEPPP